MRKMRLKKYRVESYIQGVDREKNIKENIISEIESIKESDKCCLCSGEIY